MPRLLLLDDERQVSSLVKMSLELDGFQVEICHNVPQALVKVKGEQGIHAVIVDHYLNSPQSGLDLLRAIRKGKTALPADLPVVVTSGDDRIKEPALAEGATLFLNKPYSPAELARTIHEIITPNATADDR